MRLVTYSMGTTVDGFMVGPDGGFDWGVPDPEVFEFHIEELRSTGTHLLGRKLYEVMLYWETAEQEGLLDEAEVEWARMWKELPKVVFSRTLTQVQGTNTRLAVGSLTDEIQQLRDEPGDGTIAIGGAMLAAAAAKRDLIDEYRPVVYPVLVGGGRPYYPPGLAQTNLELIENRTFASGVVAPRYRVQR